MRALTIHRPWAGLIAAGVKRVENRTWQPPLSLIGNDLAIHAGRRWDDRAVELCRRFGVSHDPEDHPTGIVAVARVLGVVVRDHGDLIWINGDPRPILNVGRFFAGPFGWVLGDVVRLARQVDARGMQGLWNLPDCVRRRVEENR